jgi:hypothetical protein
MEEHDPQLDPVSIERGFRKLYWQFGLKVLAGVGVLALVDLLPLPSKWWAVPFVLVGGWLVLVNLAAISTLAMAQHRYRTGPEDDMPLAHQERAERIVHYASYVLLVLAMVLMKLFGRLLENVVEEGRFVLVMGGVGAALAAFVLWWIKRTMPGYYQRNSEARAGAILGLFFGITVLVMFGSAWVDRSSAEQRAHVARFAVKRIGTNIKTGSNYVHVFHPGQAETDFRIQVRGKELEGMAGLDSIDLRVGAGDLGFEHVLGVTNSE